MKTPFTRIVSLDKVRISPSYGSIIVLNDGRLMWVWGTGVNKDRPDPIYANYSDDSGRSWSAPVE